MSFNPDSTKQTQLRNHSTLHVTSAIQMSNKLPFKHLCLILDSRLSFEKHLKQYLTRQIKLSD